MYAPSEAIGIGWPDVIQRPGTLDTNRRWVGIEVREGKDNPIESNYNALAIDSAAYIFKHSSARDLFTIICC